MFMKNNLGAIILSSCSYVAAILSAVITGNVRSAFYFLFILIGLILAAVSYRTKNRQGATTILLILGILGLLYPFVAWTHD